MSEENKVAEEVKEINPIDEYLERYKEQRLAIDEVNNYGSLDHR